MLVGIAIAYDSFFAENLAKEAQSIGDHSLNPLSKFVSDLNKEMPILYGMFSIVLALVLGVGAAILRRFFSNLRKKYIHSAPPASQK